MVAARDVAGTQRRHSDAARESTPTRTLGFAHGRGLEKPSGYRLRAVLALLALVCARSDRDDAAHVRAAGSQFTIDLCFDRAWLVFRRQFARSGAGGRSDLH